MYYVPEDRRRCCCCPSHWLVCVVEAVEHMQSRQAGVEPKCACVLARPPLPVCTKGVVVAALGWLADTPSRVEIEVHLTFKSRRVNKGSFVANRSYGLL